MNIVARAGSRQAGTAIVQAQSGLTFAISWFLRQISSSESVRVTQGSSPQRGLGGRLLCRERRRWRRLDSRWRLRGQRQLQVVQHGLGIFVRLGVAWQHQPAAIQHRNPDLDHLDGREFLQHRRGRQSRRVHQETVLQGDLQAVGQESYQHVRVGPLLKLMIDGPDSQLTLEAAKDTLDLCQLYAARPQHGWIFSREIAPQQIMAIPLFGGFQLGLVDLK